MSFVLHPNLSSKALVIDLPLCMVLLEDNKHYPWLFLVPRQAGVARIMDLALDAQLQLMRELDAAQKVIWQLFQPEQINVAAIGNKTPQLHVHVIGRFLTDPSWPGTVWEHAAREPYQAVDKAHRLKTLAKAFSEIYSSQG